MFWTVYTCPPLSFLRFPTRNKKLNRLYQFFASQYFSFPRKQSIRNRHIYNSRSIKMFREKRCIGNVNRYLKWEVPMSNHIITISLGAPIMKDRLIKISVSLDLQLPCVYFFNIGQLDIFFVIFRGALFIYERSKPISLFDWFSH